MVIGAKCVCRCLTFYFFFVLYMKLDNSRASTYNLPSILARDGNKLIVNEPDGIFFRII